MMVLMVKKKDGHGRMGGWEEWSIQIEYFKEDLNSSLKACSLSNFS